MALRMGTENKRQVIIACVLFAIDHRHRLLEIFRLLRRASTPRPIPAQTATGANAACSRENAGTQPPARILQARTRKS